MAATGPDLHTPDELLATAETLLASGDPPFRRAAVLEAVTALEQFVQQKVFKLLGGMLDPLLVAWLEDRTRMDFNSRLSVLTPVAVGRPVDRSSSLWSDYKRTRKIRNDITHSGKKVTAEEANFVIATVRAWLAYLGGTVDVTLSLQNLKESVESQGTLVADGRAAERLVHDYFAASPVAVEGFEVPLPSSRWRADLVLRFDDVHVVVEVKVASVRSAFIERLIEQATMKMLRVLPTDSFWRAAVVVFTPATPPEAFRVARQVENGRVSVVVIQVPDEGRATS